MDDKIPKILIALAITLFSCANLYSQIRISGSLSGTLEDTTYIVEDSVYIIEGRTLEIEAGATLLFDDGVKFIISGRLIANGTELDSILFILNDGAEAWGGLDFWIHASQFSSMEYCRVSGSNSSGIQCLSYGCPFPLSNCVISGNSSPYDGSGIRWNFYFPRTIDNCTISNNEGIGIYTDGQLTLDSCTINNNTERGIVSISSMEINNCIISDNSEGGVYAEGDLSVQNTVIARNSTDGAGGGIYSPFQGELIELYRCVIAQNNSEYWGGGISCQSKSASIRNCTIVNNSTEGNGGGIFADLYNLEIVNTCIAFNTGLGGIFNSYSTETEIHHSSFFENEIADIVVDIPELFGVINRVNSNQDSCDQYYNIFALPQLTSSENLDYSLLSSSPLIDAGDPDFPWDPDGTIADIGAIYYSQYEYLIERRIQP
ncbi:MAG: right-handed parallel beta-helix repeat-containing protein, partial [Candidatus Electryonea clarkiae]|nr:right-handed parallel beta-helix repeat-containing protein [Candidatus Electryonea clarkiae]